MKTLNFRMVITFLVISLSIVSCQDDTLSQEIITTNSTSTRAISTPWFDWENVDVMPSPPSQNIPVPWIGAGSLTSMYGIEILNDRKKTDGWELLYNTFDSNSTAQLINPYFILYNKYRGTMRIFVFITTEFITASTNLQDGLTVISNQESSILNFLGVTMVDVGNNIREYQQIQPNPDDAPPVATNRWYMMEYELAYDPNLSSISANDIQLKWNLHYHNIESFNFGGTIQGKLNAIMGSSSNPSLISAASSITNGWGKGAMSGIGYNYISKNTINSASGENKIGLPNDIFKSLASSVISAAAGSIAGFPGAAISLFNSVIGGTSSSQKPVSYSLEAQINFTGTGTTVGAFPSTPISFWVPGTNFSSGVVGYVPLYNKTLGVVNFRSKPSINIVETRETWFYELRGMYEPYRVDVTAKIPDISELDYSEYLIYNPEVLNIADIRILKQDIVIINKYTENIYKTYINSTTFKFGWLESPEFLGTQYNIGVRFMLEIVPKDGNPPTIVLKTFNLTPIKSYINIDYGGY